MNDERTIIMIVDDDITTLKIGKNTLSEAYDVFTIPSAERLFDLLERKKPGLILLDIDMPGMNGYETIRELKQRPETRDIPVVFLTGKSDPSSEIEGLSLGAIDYISKPFVAPLLLKRIEVHLKVEEQRHMLEAQALELKNFNDNLQKMVAEKTEKVFMLQNAIIKTVADLVESRDDITGWHVERTQHGLGVLVAALQEQGIYSKQVSEWDVDLLLQSSQLHDVGKISISDVILKKPGKLTPDEFDKMKEHTTFGVRIIEKIEASTTENDFLKYAKLFAGTHHERWDGSGYPLGLSGDRIPLEGRLMAIADVYDALVSERPYKAPFTHEEAVRIIVQGRGTHFDPMLVDLFQQIAGQFKLS